MTTLEQRLADLKARNDLETPTLRGAANRTMISLRNYILKFPAQVAILKEKLPPEEVTAKATSQLKGFRDWLAGISVQTVDPSYPDASVDPSALLEIREVLDVIEQEILP